MKLYKYTYVVFQVIIGFLIADLFTGTFHWFEDTYLDYCLDIHFFGEIAKENEMHHYFPRSIIAYGLWDNIKQSLIAFMFIYILIVFICRIKPNVMLYSFLFFSLFANTIHKYTHYRECETYDWFKVIQSSGLICSHAHHRDHHINVNEKYCVITEYNNYLLDSIGYWRGLEFVIYKLTGISPIRKPSPTEYSEIQTDLHTNAKLECPDKPTIEDVEMLKLKLKEWKQCNRHI